MNNVINYIKVLTIPFLVIIFMPLLLAILNLIGMKSFNWLILLIMVTTSLFSGYKIGKKSIKKGYVHGLILSFILITLMFVFSLFGKNTYGLGTMIYYFIIIVSTMVGSMFGIQKKVSD